MPWVIIIAILTGFALKWLLTNPSARETLGTSINGLKGKIRESNADGGIKFKEKLSALIEYIRYRGEK